MQAVLNRVVPVIPLVFAIVIGYLPVEGQSGEIDDLIVAHCVADGVAIPRKTNDAIFLRRVYLDAIGRIPTLAENREFISSTEPDKREKLIDALLSSSGYSKRWFHFWADLLRVSTESQVTRSGIVGSAYIEWIQNALEENIPYDRMVRDLIGRQGNIWEPENAGAVGFYLRDFGMPLEHFSILMQVFAGTRMECAQCHSHPFDRWTQMDFHHLAAFTFSVRASKYPKIYEEIKGPERSAVNRITIPMRFASVHSRPWPLKLPHDYAYNDAQPGDIVKSKFVFGPDTVHSSADDSGAETFSRWLTDPRHPRFTRVIVNRLWKELFGAPLVPPPLDDLRGDTAAYHPELENALIELMREGGYDLRAFLKVVMKSDAYQRVATAGNINPNEKPHFESPCLRRMSAEQVWDSLVTLITDDPDRPNLSRRAYRIRYLNDLRIRAEKVCGKSPDTVRAWLRTEAGKKFAANPRTTSCPEADALMQELKSSMKALDRLKNGGINGTPREFSEWKKLHYRLYRASELETPMPPGHFLRTFGQSDRSLPNNANRQSSMPQLLALFNGELSGAVENPWSRVMRSAQVAESGGADDLSVVDTVFLSVLSRLPTLEERELASGETPATLAAALLNSAEFLFVR
ncbi:MAG: DUF1549 domain-containing protein [Verrucomicrobiales bacterium]|nr:DUF1549 domain-containing protein [Verrucomicrobiales bacterium]